ncbi:MAG: anthranilate phosphoribosyltransferase, partial [Verrucomicrobiae bacterium]|nr:anthranilate phosphoribosyltransferase [Verrucomicrobiae bacterium]
GYAVAKHGNRSVSSQCGSADVVEALGIPIDLPPETVQPSLEETHFAFLFAPAYHKVFKTLQPIRQKLAENGSRSVFNLLGPLLNPVQPNVQIVGVYNSKLTEIICNVLKELGLLRAVAVHGFVDSSHESGLDEFSNCGPNRLSQLHSSGHVETIDLDISVVGLKASYLHDLKGGDKNKNAEIITGILKGEIKGAPREFVLFNASAGFVLSNLATDLKDGIAKAAAEIDSGRAWKKLEQVREFGRKHAGTHKPTRIKVDTAWLKLEREKQKRHTAIVTSPISPDEKKEE